jgi:hypothetical protein
MDAIQERIVAHVTGSDWTKYERRAQKKKAWELLEDNVWPKNRNYGITLGRRRGLTQQSDLYAAFRSASVDYRVTDDERLIEIAWAIAFDPSQLPLGGFLPNGDALQRLVVLTRGARLMKLGHLASFS